MIALSYWSLRYFDMQKQRNGILSYSFLSYLITPGFLSYLIYRLCIQSPQLNFLSLKNLELFLFSSLEPYWYPSQAGPAQNSQERWLKKKKDPDHMWIFFSYMAYDVYYQLVCKTSILKCFCSLRNYKCNLLSMCRNLPYIWISTR